MNIIQSNTEIVSAMRYEFLKNDREGNPADISLLKKKYCIYVIENLRTSKIYIGKTTNIFNRANHYILEYRNFKNGLPLYSVRRSIIQAICNEGIQNFRMYPIAIAQDRKELSIMEKQYVIEYNTLEPRGYNQILPDGSEGWNTRKCSGISQPISAKISKSKIVACINSSTKELIISIGMKLFGDYIGSSKDQVKNCAKRGIKHRGYHIIYLNEYDRESIRNLVMKRYDEFCYKRDLCIASSTSGLRGKFSEHNEKLMLMNMGDYLSASSKVSLMVDDRSAEIFINDGYTCKFLSYNTNSDSIEYEFLDISIFFSMIKDD